LTASLPPAPASAAPSWLTPVALSTPSPGAYDPEVVADPRGGAAAIWRRYDGGRYIVEAAQRANGGGWSAAEDLSSPGQPADSPRIAVDPTGGAVAVWEAYVDGHYVIQAAQRAASGSWSAPQSLSDGSQNAYRPEVAVGPAGGMVVAWESFEGGYHVIQAAERSAGGNWSAAKRLSPLADLAEGVELGIDAAGDAVAVWEAYVEGKFVVQVAERPAGGDWLAAEDLASGGQPSSPQISVDAAGDAVAVRETTVGGHFVVQAAERPAGGVWSEPYDLSSLDAPAEAPRVSMDRAGNAIAVWQSYIGGYFVVQAAERPAGGSWSAPQDLSDRYLAPQYQSARQPRVAVGPSGDAFVVWESFEVSYYVVQAIQRPVGGDWSAVGNVSPQGRDSHAAEIAVDPLGDAVAVWEGTESAGQVVQAATYADVSRNAERSVKAPISQRARGIAHAGRRARVKRGAALLRLRCRGAGDCRGVASLFAEKRPGKRDRRRPSHRIRLGRAPFSIPLGRRAVVHIHLTERGMAMIDRDHHGRFSALLRGSGVRRGKVLLVARRPSR